MDATDLAGIILVCLAPLGGYGIHYLSLQNGLYAMLSSHMADRTLPRTQAPLRTHYTGLALPDNYLTACNLFSWPSFMHNSAQLTLLSATFAGSMVPIWVILSSHPWRGVNTPRRCLAWNIFAGITTHTIGIAIMVPVLLAMKAPTLKRGRRMDMPPPPDASICIMLAIFYICPILLASKPASAFVSSNLRQRVIAFWQGWTIFVTLGTPVVRWLQLQLQLQLQLASSRTTPQSSNPEVSGRTADARYDSSEIQVRSRRYVYIFVFLCSAIPYWTMLCVAFLVRLAILPSSSRQDPNWILLIVPRLSLHGRQVTSMEEGLQRFTEYDYGVSAVALWIWCVALYQRHRGVPVRSRQTVRWMLSVMLAAFICGPSATAIWLYYDVEEMVLAKEE